MEGVFSHNPSKMFWRFKYHLVITWKGEIHFPVPDGDLIGAVQKIPVRGVHVDPPFVAPMIEVFL